MTLDTGKCAPEGRETLLLQQGQLLTGKRHVQMFPIGTTELQLPTGFHRHEGKRGVFYYNASKITSDEIEELSTRGRENEFLNLGRFSKIEIYRKYLHGEPLIFVTELTPDKTEVRCAVGTLTTVQEQQAYFNQTKEPENTIVIGLPPKRVSLHLMKG